MMREDGTPACRIRPPAARASLARLPLPARTALLVLSALAALPIAAAQPAEQSCSVKFVSAEHVYLDAGTMAGLAVGMVVDIVRDHQVVAELEVGYCAEHSASCRIVSKRGEIVAGDLVVYEPVAVPAAAPETASGTPEAGEIAGAAPSRTRATVEPTLSRSRRGPVRVKGWLALQWDHTQESTDHTLQTDLLSMPFRLRAANLGSGFEFHARGALRRISRSGFSGATPAMEWRNRILEVAVVREGRDLNWEFACGRVGGRLTTSAGPFDGLEIRRRLGSGVRFGLFGGFAPEWGDLGLATEDHLMGAVFDLERSTSAGRLLAMTVAVIGRYRRRDISREYVTVTTTWRDGNRLSLLQGAEIDLNRAWRREAAGQSLTLTSGALTGRYRISDVMSLDLGYDNREPVRTWQTRSLPDSLFTEAGRNGWRGGVSWRGRQGFGLNISGGIRGPQGAGQQVRSWQSGLVLPDDLVRWADLTVLARGFDGPALSGWSRSLRLDRNVRGRPRLNLEAGRFDYTGQAAADTRKNSWAEFGTGLDLAPFWEVTASFRQDWGDDTSGSRWWLELARRF